MFKSIDAMEKCMAKNLIILQSGKSCDDIFNGMSDDVMNAFHACYESGFLNNIKEYQTADGKYHFDSVGNVHVSEAGLKFIKNKSIRHRIGSCVIETLKGMFGFWIGVFSTIVLDILIRILFYKDGLLGFIEHLL